MKLLSTVIAVVICLMAHAADPETLGDVLTQHGLSAALVTAEQANQTLSSYVVAVTLDGAPHQPFLLAYYDLGIQSKLNLPGILTVLSYDEAGKKLKQAHLQVESKSSQVGAPVSTHLSDECFGTVENIETKRGFIRIGTHLGPNAGCLLVINPDLTFQAALHGWKEGDVRGSVIFRPSTPHFVAVHPTTLWVYNPADKASAQLYPQPNDPQRAAFSAELSKHIPAQDYCREHNLACDPNVFSSDVMDLKSSDETGQVFFDIRMTAEGFGDAAASIPPASGNYVAMFEKGKWLVGPE
jgi:hypothetical protein